MPAYSFKERFVPLVKEGTKTQTIRAKRKRQQIKPGDTVYLYYGMRTKHCMKIGEGICTEVLPVHFTNKGFFCDGKLIETNETDAFAKADGFKNLDDMYAWWKDVLPFEGELIKWKLK